MVVKKIAAISVGTLMLVTNITPVFANEVYSMRTDTAIQICKDSIDSSSHLINDIIEGIQIEKEEPVQDMVIYNDLSYTQAIVYTHIEQEIPTEKTMTVDEFMNLYGSMKEEASQEITQPVDISTAQAAYDQALANYNMALAEYESANQMIETTKEAELEIIEEVTDEEGNVSEVVKTEIQIFTEMIPAGDVQSAQANLDAAKVELDNAQMALDAIQNVDILQFFEDKESVTNLDEIIQGVQDIIDMEDVVTEESTLASEGGCLYGLSWSQDDQGVLRISGTGSMEDFQLYKLGENSYYGRPWDSTAKSVIIEKGVKSIGDYAFYGFKNLTSITISEGVTDIGLYAFSECPSLIRITMPASVEYIEYNAFEGCTGLKSAGFIGSGCDYEFGWNKFIPDYAFSNCTSMTDIIIPDGVTQILNLVCAGCTSLTNITIPDSVNHIGEEAFLGCKSLTSIKIPKSMTSIGFLAFESWTGLTNITIPDTVISIDHSAFSGCIGLSSITIPESVTRIDEYAFDGCTALTDIYYLSTEEKWNQIEKETASIPSHTKIHFLVSSGTCGENLTWTLYDEGLLAISGTGDMTNYSMWENAPWGKDITNVNIAEGVTGIGNFAFAGCSKLANVQIPDSVTSIRRSAFSGCIGLTSLTIPDSVTSVSGFAFQDCTGLTDVSFSNGVTSIGSWAFSGCTNLANVTIPNSVISIGTAAFDKTPFLDAQNEEFVILGSVLYKYQGSSNEVKIPDNIKTIGCSAFALDAGLTNVTIPNSVNSIDDGAFSDCTGITSIVIPDSVANIGVGAFNGCTGLTNITMPSKADRIGENAFYGCTGLTSIVIPDGVTSLAYTFTNCTGLTSVIIPDSVTAIKYEAFKGCTSIENIDIPDSVTTIEYSAFENCTSLKEFVIPDRVTTLGSALFKGCTNLTCVTIPNTVAYIPVDAFSGCNRIKDVYYIGEKTDWENEDYYDFGEDVTIHFIKPFPFKDVPKDTWYYSVAKDCYETGLINGTSATTFSPMQTMTRAMVVTILWRMDGQPKTDFNNKFKDVSSSQWYATSISWAANNGVVNGYGDGTFKPDAAVTREQVAVMLANYAQYKKVYLPGTKKLNTYPDGSQVSTWAQQGMKWALTNGIVSGDGAGYLRPKKSATRAEGAAMLLRMNNWL